MPLSLFSRALVTLIVTFGLFAFLAFAAVVQFALAPVVDRSTQDLSALMLLATRALGHLEPERQADFRARIDRDYGLRLLAPGQEPRGLGHHYFPYMARLERTLAERVGAPVAAGSNLEDGERWFWVHLPAGADPIWVGFPRERIQSRPYEGIFLVVVVSIVRVSRRRALLGRRVAGQRQAPGRQEGGDQDRAEDQPPRRRVPGCSCRFSSAWRMARRSASEPADLRR